jgi:hypothetical protein
VRPLLYFITGTALGGEAIAYLKEKAFGIERRDATLSEIGHAVDADVRDGLVLIATRVLNDMLVSGSAGIFGTPLQMARDVTERSKFRNPLNPPGVSLFKNIGDVLLSWFEQGKITGRDLTDFLKSSVSAYRYADAFLKEQAHNADLGWKAAELKARRDDVSFLRNVANRYAREVGIEPTTRTTIGRVGKSEITPMRQDLLDALLVGDANEAKRIVTEYLNGFSSVAEMDKKLDGLRESVAQSQPVKVAAIAGRERRIGFLEWANKHLSPSDVERIKSVDEAYRTTAIEAGLLNIEEPWQTLRLRLRAEIQERRKATPATPEQKAQFIRSNVRRPFRKLPPKRMQLTTH